MTNIEKTMYQEKTVKLGFGSVCIQIDCPIQEFMEKILSDCPSFMISREPDFWIQFNLRNKLTATEIKQLLQNSRSYFNGNRFFTKPELLDCRISWAEATLWVDTERQLFAPNVEYKLMNPLMRGIYSGVYTKFRNTRPDAYLVHGCGIASGEQCFLFTGPSGSGKTTVAKLADGRKVLNDEAVLIGRDDQGFYLSGTPFDGGVSNRCNTTGHLTAILFLRHDSVVSLRKLSKVETYHRLLTQIFDTYPLFETETSCTNSLQERADLSVKVATEVPSYELGFLPDTSFWPVVEDI